MPNVRIFYAVHQVGMAEIGSQSFTALHGVQSVGITTTFNLEQVFELGEIAIYENIENIPDVEVTLEKVLDGYPLIYHLATKGSSSATLAGRSTAQTIVGLSIFSDVQDASSGTPLSECQMSGMFVSSLSYTFPVEGNFTESVTMVGNNKVWDTAAAFAFNGAFTNTDSPAAIAGSGGVNRREDLLFDHLVTGVTQLDTNGSVALGSGLGDCRGTVVPQDMDGVSSSGTVDFTNANPSICIQNITISTDLGREELFCLGKRAPVSRYVTFPIEVTCEFEVLSTRGDLVSATEDGVLGNGNNLTERTIFIRTREGSTFNLGYENKLASTSYTGGDATGGNVSVTYSYSTYNDLTIEASHDPTAALRIAQHPF